MICIALTFGRRRESPGRQHRAQRVHRAHIARSVPDNRGDDGASRGCRYSISISSSTLHAAVLAHTPEVVAPEVYEHHVLGTLLLVGQQLSAAMRRSSPGLGATRTGPGNWARRDVTPVHRQQRLRAGPHDLEVAEVQIVQYTDLG